MRKYIITAELRELEWKVSKGEISYSRMIEILCEKADEYAKMYHEQELSKLHQPTVSDSVGDAVAKAGVITGISVSRYGVPPT